jgi:hypothetical protein
MSVSAVAPTPFYQDPDRLQIGLPQVSAAGAEKAGSADSDGKHLSMFADGDDSPSFWDVLDVINPLQHIPVINDIYRDLTGDKIGVGARLVGGALFGGPIGLAAAAANCMVEESTGKDVGEHVLALFKDDQPATPDAAPTTMVASAPTQSNSPVAAAAVSSSPAKAAAADAAPVIALPETGAAQGGAQPMVFSLDGMQAAPAAAVAAQAQPSRLDQGAAQSKPMPLMAANSRFMTAPARKSAEAAPLPQVTVPVSNGSARSNVPVTGRNPQAATTAAAQRALAAQENTGNHPMLPPADANGQTAASPDWFTAAWGQALDKYQRANQRNDKTSSGATTSTLE